MHSLGLLVSQQNHYLKVLSFSHVKYAMQLLQPIDSTIAWREVARFVTSVQTSAS